MTFKRCFDKAVKFQKEKSEVYDAFNSTDQICTKTYKSKLDIAGIT